MTAVWMVAVAVAAAALWVTVALVESVMAERRDPPPPGSLWMGRLALAAGVFGVVALWGISMLSVQS